MEEEISNKEQGESKPSYLVSPHGLTKTLVTMLWVNVGVMAVVGLSDLMQWMMLTGEFTEAQAVASDNRQMLISLVGTVYWIALGVVFLRWIYRANKNCHHFGAEDMKFSPGWSIGFYFIPLLNLYKPYRAMREIWQVSQDPSDWKNQKPTKLLGVWWALWIFVACFF